MSDEQAKRDTPPPAPEPRKKRKPRCAACGQPMSTGAGYGGTGLCGPCATGDADTLDEIGETW